MTAEVAAALRGAEGDVDMAYSATSMLELAPDAVFAEQFYDPFQALRERGETQLHLAVLRDAVMQYLRAARPTADAGEARRVRHEILTWIKDLDGDYVVNFRTAVTRGLPGADVEWVQRGLLRRLRAGMVKNIHAILPRRYPGMKLRAVVA